MAYLGEEIRKLGFGLMRLPMKGEVIDVEQTKEMVDRFLEAGFTYFDTAWAYAGSEDAIRQALVERYPRDSFQLATKNAAWINCKTREEAIAQFDTSLKQTRAGYFDFYLLHNLGESRTRFFDDYDMWSFVQEKKKEGLIRHVGFSFHSTPEELEEILKAHPEMEFFPRTFIFGAKAAAGYKRAKLTIKLINAVADVVNNDPEIQGKLKVVFIEDYRVSNAEIIFAAADVSEQISTASKEASGTGNMKFMLNGALTIGTMDGANVEIVEEVGEENAFIFGMSADEVINYEKNGGYYPIDIFNSNGNIRRVMDQLINGTFSPGNPGLFRDIYNSLLSGNSIDRADTYFILGDAVSYGDAQRRVDKAYRDKEWWAKAAILNVACSGKFSSDRTIKEYVDELWHLDKIEVKI